MTALEQGQFSGDEVSAVLESLEDPAIIIGRDHRIRAVNSHYAAAFGDGAEILGRRCHEISHHFPTPCDEMGEVCPVHHCLRAGNPCQVVHVHHTPAGEEHKEIGTYPILNGSGEISSILEVIRPSQMALARPARNRMVGRSPAFNHMLELARRVAPRSTPVLLLGESGTGKELLAKTVHELGTRCDRPFVPVDCSGLSETLFESELFGHERGAFTGATGRKTGLVEAANGGTLFLDEVGDIPLPQQVKLLRLLETGKFRRVGSVDLQRSDFRLICATHRNLLKMVEQGTFRSDLYFRISVFPIPLPPLRIRRGDLALLAECMLRQVGCKRIKKVDPKTLAALERYHFPGNVRELRNFMERACLMAEGDTILPEHLPSECFQEGVDRAPVPPEDELLPLDEIERRYLSWALNRFDGSHRELASRLGVSERTLYRKLGKVRDPGSETE